jgi:hypothetical protein
MSQLTQLIRNVPDWQELTSEQLLTKLEEKTIHYIDPKIYRLVDIAKLIGDENMPAFLAVVRQAGYDWMITEAASGVQLGDNPINARLRLLNHPVSIMLADYTNRMVSVLEQNNITTTQEEVAQVQASMKFDLYKQSKIDAAQDRVIVYREAMTVYNGVGPEPEL